MGAAWQRCVGESPRRAGWKGQHRSSGSFSARRRPSAGACSPPRPLTILALAAVSAFLAWRQYRANQHRAVSDLNARVVLVGDILDTLVQGGINTLRGDGDASPVVRRADGRDAALPRARPPESAGQALHGRDRLARHERDRSRQRPRARCRRSTSPTATTSSACSRRRSRTSAPASSAPATGKPTVVVAVPTFDRRGKARRCPHRRHRPQADARSPRRRRHRQNEALGFTGLTDRRPRRAS